MSFAVNLPLNDVSFGQVSIIFLKTYLENIEKYGEKISALLPVMNQLTFESFVKDEKFDSFIRDLLQKGNLHNKKTPVFKLWHLHESLQSYSNDQTLFSFYELDQPTQYELNIARNNKMAFSSKYTIDIFKSFGVESNYIPLCFDDFSFKRNEKKYFSDDRIVFNLVGKFEKRKNHEKIIRSWIKKYGNNRNYYLQCAVFNGHLPDAEKQYQMISQALTDGGKYFNVHFLPRMAQNSVYNDFLNSGDIVLGMSGGEGWGLPEFHSVALGKHSVILNATGYKEWATNENSVLVEPSQKIEAYDNFFFKKGASINQGNIFDFNEDDFINGCEQAIKRVMLNKKNEKGIELQSEFSRQRMTDTIINLMN